MSRSSLHEGEALDTRHYAETMFSKVSAQADALRTVEANQRALEATQAQKMGDEFGKIDRRIGHVEEEVHQHKQQIQALLHKQDDLLRMLMIQEKVAQQDHQIREFIAYQQSVMMGTSTPDGNKQMQTLRNLQENQAELSMLLAQLRGKTEGVSAYLSSLNPEQQPDPANPNAYHVPGVAGEEVETAPELKRVPIRLSEPTVFPDPDADKFVDAKAIRRAVRGLGCDERALIRVLAARSWQQRKAIAQAYKDSYSRDMIQDIKKNTGMNFERALVGLCHTPEEYDALTCRQAIDGLGTNDTMLIEVICTRQNWQILKIIDVYKEMFQRSLVNDVQSDTSGYYKQLLLAILQGNRRDEPTVVNMTEVYDACRRLYAAGEARMGTDEKTFIEIFSTYSFAELAEICEHYRKISDFALERAVAKETSFNFKQALVTILRYAQDPHEYYAELAYRAMRGVGTNERLLTRVLVSRCEVDLKSVATSYRELFDEDLIGRVRREVGGNYGRLMIALFGNEAFDPHKDAKRLYKALHRIFGSKKDTVNAVLGYRTEAQRLLIAQAYQENYKEDLRARIKDKLFKEHELLCLALLKPRVDYIAEEIHRCVAGLGTKDSFLIEILCSMTGAEMEKVKEKYQELFSTGLADDVKADTSGDYQDLLLALIANDRKDAQPRLDEKKVQEEASRLLKAGEEDRLGTDEATFVEIFSKYSWANLRLIFDHYSKISDKDIAKVVREETSFNFEQALVAIVQIARDPTTYFASRLHSFMKRVGTSDQSLIRVMVLRFEIDLPDIAEAYYQKYRRSLESHIISDTSGYYRRLLQIMLMNANTMAAQTQARRRMAENAVKPDSRYLHTGTLGLQHDAHQPAMPRAGPTFGGVPGAAGYPPAITTGYGSVPGGATSYGMAGATAPYGAVPGAHTPVGEAGASAMPYTGSASGVAGTYGHAGGTHGQNLAYPPTSSAPGQHVPATSLGYTSSQSSAMQHGAARAGYPPSSFTASSSLQHAGSIHAASHPVRTSSAYGHTYPQDRTAADGYMQVLPGTSAHGQASHGAAYPPAHASITPTHDERL